MDTNREAQNNHLGEPFLILISYQQQADKLRFIEQLTTKNLESDLQFKVYHPDLNPGHGTGKLIGLLVEDAKNNRLSLVTSLSTNEQDQIDYQFLSYINLHRDCIIYQNLHYVLFIPATQMGDFMVGAPDLWSFRQQIIYLERDVSQTIPNVELSSELMWQHLTTDLRQSKREQTTLAQANEKITQTQKLVAQVTADNDKAKLLLDLAQWLIGQEFYIQAFEIGKQLINEQSKYNTKLLAYALYDCGNAQYHTNQYQEAISYLSRAIPLAEQNNLNTLTTILYETLGDTYFHFSDFKRALKYFEKTQLLAEKFDLTEQQIIALRGQTRIKIETEYLDDSIAILEQALAIAIKLDDSNNKALIKTDLGKAFIIKTQYDLALKNYQSALQHYKKIQYLNGIATCQTNIAQILILEQDFDGADKYLKQSLAIAETLNDKLLMANTDWCLAQCYRHNSPKQALIYAQKSHQLYTQLNHSSANIVAELINDLKTSQND